MIDYRKMRLNNLKFREITSAITNQINLDLFTDDNALFSPKNPNSTSRGWSPRSLKNRPGSTGHDRSVYHNFNYTSASQRKQSPPEDTLFHLQKSLLAYTERISAEERRSIRRQLENMLELLTESCADVAIDRCESLEGDLSKKFKNRLVHLAFYLIYNKLCGAVRERKLEREIKNYILCEYYGRKFNFKEFTLSICTELQGMYCGAKKYQESRQYARKCLRLAVVLDNSYAESKMIENLSILNYYEGRLSQEPPGLLSLQEKKRIIESYSQQKEMPPVFNFQRTVTSNQSPQFSIERHNNFIENSIPSENVRYFQTHYHDIVKTMPKRNLNVRQIISKVSGVGLVRKYFGKDNYITIRPQCHIIKPTHQEQVLITHKKSSKTPAHQVQALAKVMRRVLGMLQNTIDCYKQPL